MTRLYPGTAPWTNPDYDGPRYWTCGCPTDAEIDAALIAAHHANLARQEPPA